MNKLLTFLFFENVAVAMATANWYIMIFVDKLAFYFL